MGTYPIGSAHAKHSQLKYIMAAISNKHKLANKYL